LDDFKQNIRLAKSMGCKFIVTSTGEAHFGKKEGQDDDILADHISRVVPVLEECDITMALELHGVYAKGGDMARVTRRLASPRVGIAYDTANVLFYGGVSPIDDVKTCVDQVKYVHLKDKVGGKGVWNFPGAGSGELPLGEFMEYMDAHRYGGPYSVEIEYDEAFCMREKDRPGDIDIPNGEMADSFRFLRSLGRV
jgi:sugar phosphate isomerase/epimerase